MTTSIMPSPANGGLQIDDCWNRIGVHGDQSCERLREHHHCRHCEVYGAAARTLMQRAIPSEDQAEWTSRIAQPATSFNSAAAGTLVFRLGQEWLALPAGLFVNASGPVKAHKVPHRNNPVLHGIVNVRGQLYPCMSLAALLGIADMAEAKVEGGRRSFPRLLLARLGRQSYALPVTEVYGMHRYAEPDVQAIPTTASRDMQPLLRGVLMVDDKQVGLLAAERIAPLLAECLR